MGTKTHLNSKNRLSSMNVKLWDYHFVPSVYNFPVRHLVITLKLVFWGAGHQGVGTGNSWDLLPPVPLFYTPSLQNLHQHKAPHRDLSELITPGYEHPELGKDPPPLPVDRVELHVKSLLSHIRQGKRERVLIFLILVLECFLQVFKA